MGSNLKRKREEHEVFLPLQSKLFTAVSDLSISPTLSNNLNFLRWIAAFLVVVGHLRSLMFPEYTKLVNPSIFQKIFYFITGLGHEGVIIFFVISGFLVGGEFIKMPKINYINFYIKRFSRIYTVFIPALIIGGILDYIGINYFNSNGYYNNLHHFSAMDYSVIDRLNLGTFISNLFMMQTSLTETFGSNGPLWSLANEWWYYMLFPLLYIFFSDNIRIRKLLSMLGILIILFILNSLIILYFFIWLLGAWIFYYRKKVYFPFLILISYSILFFSFVISRINLFGNSYVHDLCIALSLIFLINNLSFMDSQTQYLKKINQFLADFSYSLYLFHFPFIVLFLSIVDTEINRNYVYVSLLLFLYMYSLALYYVFERNTYRIKSYLLSKIGNV